MSNDIEIDEVDPSVGFLYRAMLQRDPKKRRVKPVQKHLIQLDFGFDDSDDDSDFEVEKHGKGSDSDSENERSETAHDASESSTSSDDQTDEPDVSDEAEHGKYNSKMEDCDEAEQGKYNLKMERLKHEVHEKARIKSPEASASSTTTATTTVTKYGKIKVLICCVCLGDISEETDEIVECDNCGVSVHEGCYGISDNQSAASTESSASTEPWFCDACKAGKSPMCELCPNLGGIFKETDAGKWVHLVCALYTPGVAFGDVDRLSPVTLFEMPYSRWGTRECSLCEDQRFSRTGVCIGCDAGMCRSYFHVTCAQRDGLLSEASPDEVLDIADPFFAYCKMHADKNMARAKRRNWLAIQSHVKQHAGHSIDDEKEKARFERKLNRHKEKYVVAKANRPPSWVPTQKLVRYLTSSPSAVRRMLRKAELMGILTQTHHDPSEKLERSRKKFHSSAAFSAEFVNYFLDRNIRIENMKTNLRDLLSQNEKLHEQEKILRQQYDQILSDVEKMRDSTSKQQRHGIEIWDIVNAMAESPLPVPEILHAKTKFPSLSRKGSSSCLSPPSLIHQCGICKATHSQHMLAKCDTCLHHYHLDCLDPPLSRMPKKTKLMGWQCSECLHSDSNTDCETQQNLDAPRRLRENVKGPVKFSPTHKVVMQMKRDKKIHKRKRKRKHKYQELKQELPEPKRSKSFVKKKCVVKLSKSPDEIKEESVKSLCATCSDPGKASFMVKCDECQLSYHFRCLDPPLRKTPKQRGYTWHCAACDPSDDSDIILTDHEEREEYASGTQEGDMSTAEVDEL